MRGGKILRKDGGMAMSEGYRYEIRPEFERETAYREHVQGEGVPAACAP